MTSVPTIRVRAVNHRAPAPDGDFVLYWMIANRRTRWNFSLDRAVEWARELHKPLVVLEALRCGYEWASDRLHRFVLQGMSDNRQALSRSPALYYPYVERRAGDGRGLLEALAQRACMVVTDEYPCFFLPRMVESTAPRLPVKLEAVDSNGLLPLRAADRDFPTAYAFRRFLQKTLPRHLNEAPRADPFRGIDLPRLDRLPREIASRRPAADDRLLQADSSALADLDIDHTVGPAAMTGGSQAAQQQMRVFLERKLPRYGEERNHPDADAASGFSPYLHFGQLSVHEVFHELAAQEDWKPDQLSSTTSGAREGWWNMSPSAESFLDELITWRELGFNMCSQRADYDQYESLPDWSQRTLAEHAGDRREFLYSLDEFATSRTHDGLWNAAQTQLREEGRMHNYLRMLWGKKILEWTESPREALRVMLELNNKYAVDGRDPNSYSGIFWVLGRYDRAWGPERPIYGKIRYMTSDSTRRKLRLREYLQRYGGGPGG